MKSTYLDNLLDLLVSIFLLFVTVHLFPYIVTQEKYSNSKNVNPLFRIAIIKNGAPSIVQWSESEKNPENYKDKLIVNPTQDEYPLSEFEFFTLKKISDNCLILSVHEDDYNFWSAYLIINNSVQPKKFRFNGVFSVGYGFLIAFIGTPLLSWLRRKYFKKQFSVR